MIDRIEALEAALAAATERADARVAAALREAANALYAKASDYEKAHNMAGDREHAVRTATAQTAKELRDQAKAILALIDSPDAGAAFDRAIAEARKDEREACADLVASCVWGDYWTLDGEPVEPLLLAAAIRARTTGEEQ